MDYTLKKIAELAQINVSSCRYYRDLYEQYFTSTGEGRHRRYAESNIALLKTISKLYSEGMLAAQIVEVLDSSYGVPTDIVPTIRDSRQVQNMDIIEGIRDMLKEELTSRDDAIEKLSQQVSELSQGSKDRDLRLMENIRLLQAQQQRKWWNIFKK